MWRSNWKQQQQQQLCREEEAEARRAASNGRRSRSTEAAAGTRKKQYGGRSNNGSGREGTRGAGDPRLADVLSRNAPMAAPGERWAVPAPNCEQPRAGSVGKTWRLIAAEALQLSARPRTVREVRGPEAGKVPGRPNRIGSPFRWARPEISDPAPRSPPDARPLTGVSPARPPCISLMRGTRCASGAVWLLGEVLIWKPTSTSSGWLCPGHQRGIRRTHGMAVHVGVGDTVEVEVMPISRPVFQSGPARERRRLGHFSVAWALTDRPDPQLRGYKYNELPASTRSSGRDDDTLMTNGKPSVLLRTPALCSPRLFRTGRMRARRSDMRSLHSREETCDVVRCSI